MEGAEQINRRLQKQRAESVIKAIEAFQKRKIITEVHTGENWVEFMQELARKNDGSMSGLSNEEIKTKLQTDKALAATLEPMLSSQRKAVITIYMDYKTSADDIGNQQLIPNFKEAIAKKDLCEIFYKNQDYAARDKTPLEVKQNFLSKSFSDRDLLSLGKYLCWYGRYEWADELISPRMDKLEVEEDLLFFYLNLSYFMRRDFRSEKYNNMLLNAISIK